MRLCRGCSYGLAGGFLGGVAALVVPSFAGAVIAAACSAMLLLASAKLRPSKIVSRFVPAGLFGYAIGTGVLALTVLGFAIAALAIALAGGLRLAYAKRGPDRTPCVTCPERALQPCSGFAPIVSRERAFQRVARKYL